MRTITTVVVGAGHAGLAMSRCLAGALDRPRGPRARRGRQLLADRALGLAPAADAQLAEPAARPRPMRATIPTASARCPRSIALHRPATRARSRRRCETATTVTSVRPADAGYLVRTDRGDWHARTVVIAPAARATSPASRPRRHPAGVGQDAHGGGVPEPGPARARRRAGGRRVRHRRPARRRDPPLGPPGDAGGGRAHQGAPDLPGPGHPVVDGRQQYVVLFCGATSFSYVLLWTNGCPPCTSIGRR